MHNNTGIRLEAIGVISEAPKMTRHLTGVPVTKLMLAADAGPATRPVLKPVYVWGTNDEGEFDPRRADLAERCAKNLRVGDRIFVPGTERHRTVTVNGVPTVEAALIAEDVRLRERAPVGGGDA